MSLHVWMNGADSLFRLLRTYWSVRGARAVFRSTHKQSLELLWKWLQEHLTYILRRTRPIVIFFLFSGRSYRHIWKQKRKGLYSNPSKYKFGLTWNCDRNILLNVMIVQLLLIIIIQLLLKHLYYLKKIIINIFLWKLINLRCVWLLQFNETNAIHKMNGKHLIKIKLNLRKKIRLIS